MIKSRCGYTALLWLLLPRIVWHLVKRGWRQPAYLRHVGERFGFFYNAPERPVIWLHAVSVGETRAAAPIIQLLRARYPDHQVLLTHMTPTGRETGQSLYGETVLQSYLPYDFPFAINRFLKRYQPAIGLLMETEIWFNLIHGCRVQGTPILLINGRLSEKSAAKYGRYAPLTREALRELSAISAQTSRDAERLKALGAPDVQVTGNLKFDIEPPVEAVRLGQMLRTLFGSNRPVFLAASTREGEEAAILDALDAVSIPELLTVIVPRHPQRFGEVAKMLETRGLPYLRRSENKPVPPEARVVLGDSMGEMFGYYAAADAAFIGGSLLPYGGQNLIEACAMGRPALVGPHTFNFEEIAIQAVESGAVLRVKDALDLARWVSDLLRDPKRRAEMSQAGLAFSEFHRGAGQRIMEIIDATLRLRA